MPPDNARTSRPQYLRGLLLTLCGVLVLTPDSLLVRLIAIGNWELIFWRGMLMAGALLAFHALRDRGRIWPRYVAIGRAGIAAGLLFALSTTGFVNALRTTSVANTLLIISTAPLISAVLGHFLFDQVTALRTWIAALASLGGIAIILSGSLQTGSGTGELWALLSALAISGHFLALGRGRGQDMSPAVTIGGLTLALLAWPLADDLIPTAGDWPWLALLGLVVLPGSFGLISVGPRYLPAAEVSLIMLLETVLAPLLVWAVLGENPGTHSLLGGAVVLLALAGNAALPLLRRNGKATGQPFADSGP